MVGTIPIAAPARNDVIERGLLPENLPPVFTSSMIPAQYSSIAANDYISTDKTVGSLASFNASKRGGLRRLFATPHPNFVFDQATYFSTHWPALVSVFDKSPNSLSKPQIVLGGDGRRSIRITPHSQLPEHRFKCLSRFKYCLTTDVSRCFPSIYTHSIPWAINGRSAAKADTKANSATVHGNRLDFLFRQAQQRQTIGIPVGPDTSRMTSELILSAVDEQFLQHLQHGKSSYFRHVDDYWIGAHTAEDCDRLLNRLRLSLRSFELDTNEFKTKIQLTSAIFGDVWPKDIERDLQHFGVATWSSIEDKVSNLGRIIDRAHRSGDDGVVRHAIRKLDEQHAWLQNWELLEHFLAQCAVQFPHSFDYVARIVAWRHRLGSNIDKKMWVDVTKRVIVDGAPFGRDSETLWALWLLKELNVKIAKATSDIIIANSSPLVRGFLAHLFAHGLTNDSLVGGRLWASVAGDIFAGSDWPLTLELLHLAVPKPAGIIERAHERLRILHNAGVSLIDWDAAPAVFASGGADPEEAIEDFSSEYDVDSNDHDDDGDEIPDDEEIQF